MAGTLESGWTIHQNEGGKTYYYNSKTKTSRWDAPIAIQTLTQKSLAESPWKEYSTDDGKKYYYNTDSKETTWTSPPDYQILVDRVTAEIQSNLINAEPKEFIPLGMNFKTKEEAAEAFLQVLDDVGVEPHWTWEMVVRIGNTHEMYRALNTVNDRKSVFERYVSELAQSRAEARHDRLENDEEILRKLFVRKTDIVGTTRFREVAEMFDGTIEYESTELINRRIVVQKYTEELRVVEKESEREKRRIHLAKFKDLLQSMNLLPIITWKEFQVICEPFFKDDSEFEGMQSMDILTSFEDHIMTVDSQYKNSRIQDSKDAKKLERVHRDEFRQLLNEYKSSGFLNINSKWKELFLQIQKEPRYLDAVGDTGSSPLDQFRDELMIMEDSYRQARRIILDAIKATNFTVQTNTSLNDFTKFFRREFESLESQHIKIAFDELIRISQVRDDDDKRHNDRKSRKKIDAFKSYLRHLPITIRETDTWLQVKSSSMGPEYDALDEDQRIFAFEREKGDEKDHGRDRDHRRRGDERGERDKDRDYKVKRHQTGDQNRSDDERREKKRRAHSSDEDGQLNDRA